MNRSHRLGRCLINRAMSIHENGIMSCQEIDQHLYKWYGAKTIISSLLNAIRFWIVMEYELHR